MSAKGKNDPAEKTLVVAAKFHIEYEQILRLTQTNCMNSAHTDTVMLHGCIHVSQ